MDTEKKKLSMIGAVVVWLMDIFSGLVNLRQITIIGSTEALICGIGADWDDWDVSGKYLYVRRGRKISRIHLVTKEETPVYEGEYRSWAVSGKYLYNWETNGNQLLKIHLITKEKTLAYEGEHEDWAVSGKYLYIWENDILFRIDLLTKEKTQIYRDGYSGEWGDWNILNNRLYIRKSYRGFFKIDIATNEETPLYECEDEVGSWTISGCGDLYITIGNELFRISEKTFTFPEEAFDSD